MAGSGPSEQTSKRSEAEAFACLDDAFAHQKHLAPEVLASIRAWQRTDRTYELLQRVRREIEISDMPPLGIESAITMGAHLDAAIATGRLIFPLVVYRGLRSLRRALGHDCPSEVVGRTFMFGGYSATSVSRRVAVDQFTTARGALLEIILAAGTPALWIAGVGERELRNQGELLLPDGVLLHVYSHRQEGPIPVFSAEVINR